MMSLIVDHIENLTGKIVVGKEILGLFYQNSKLSENVDRLVTANEKLNSELLIVRNVNQNLQNRITNLEKQQSKSEQYNRRNKNRRTSTSITSFTYAIIPIKICYIGI